MEVTVQPQPSSAPAPAPAPAPALWGGFTHLNSPKNWETQPRSLPQGKWKFRGQRRRRQVTEAPRSWQMQHLWGWHGGGRCQHRTPPGSPVRPHPDQPCHVSVCRLATDTGPLIKPPTFSKSPISAQMGLFGSRRIWMPEHHPWGLLTCAVPTQGMGNAVGTRAPQPHLLCHPLQLLPDVGDEEAVEALFISPSLAQPAGVLLQEGERGCVPGTVGGVGLETRGCQMPGTHQEVLVDAEPVMPAQLPNDLGSQSARQHSQHAAGGQWHRHPQHRAGVPVGVTPGVGWGRGQSTFPQCGGLCLHSHPVAKIPSGRCSGGCSALTFLLGDLMLHFRGGGAQEGPACSSSSAVGQWGGAAAPCSAGTSAPSPQGAVVKEVAGRGDVGLVALILQCLRQTCH